jgi:hypothetical protein
MRAISVGDPRVRRQVLTNEGVVATAINPRRERAGRRAGAQIPWAGRSSTQPAAVALTWSRSKAGLCGAWVPASEPVEPLVPKGGEFRATSPVKSASSLV